VLDDVIETARWTGSAKNTQPWHIVVVRDRDVLRQLATCGPYASHLAGAPLALAIVMPDGNRRFDEGRLAQTLMLAAWAHGVGSCIASLFPDDNAARARALLGVPAERWLHTSIAMGYPADEQALRVSTELADGRSRLGVPVGRKGGADFVSYDRFKG
jgi:nitroreductase